MPVTLITGTSRGIGKHLAERLLLFGDTVVGCSRGPAVIQHERYLHIAMDLESANAEMLMRGVDRVDNLINCAAIASMNLAMLTPMAKLRQIFEVNTIAAYLLSTEAVRKKCKRIVNFTTVAVPLNLAGESAYAASKAAVESMTRTMAKEFAPMGCTVNAVGPTPIETDLIKGIPQAKLDKLFEQQAIKRMGAMADVDNIVDFFLSSRSDFVTGQVIYLGGVS